jgi:hypothetical protein
MATEAAWLKGKTSYREEKEKTDLTLTGLLMEGLGTLCRRNQTPAKSFKSEDALSSPGDE